ncbi:MAG TPA: polysaccharide biosynthesis/export family protein [Longimicrobium sp.]|jgi:polysaccharide export outer membrane protein|nr:polysaccharide biosynthesis/export family protein [Longimicrobium sp.]
MRRRFRMIRLAPLVLALLACAASLRAQDSASTAAAPAQDQGAWLQPGDIIKIAIWREADLSGEFRVNEDGMVMLPMLGSVRAVGVPVAELRATLVRGYSRQLANPSIDITPLRRIFVLGQVARPGPYAVDPTITLAGAVALAGGATGAGDLRRIFLVRQGSLYLTRERVTPLATLNNMAVRSGDQIFVAERAWLERNGTMIVGMALSVVGLVISLAR